MPFLLVEIGARGIAPQGREACPNTLLHLEQKSFKGRNTPIEVRFGNHKTDHAGRRNISMLWGVRSGGMNQSRKNCAINLPLIVFSVVFCVFVVLARLLASSSDSQTAVRGMLHRDPSAALRKSLEDPPIFCKDEAVKVRTHSSKNIRGCSSLVFVVIQGVGSVLLSLTCICRF